MAVTNLRFERRGAEAVRLLWDSDGDGPFYVWLDGVLVAERSVKFYDLAIAALQRVRVSVFDDAGESPGAVSINRQGALQWGPVAGATAYRIEQYVDAAWVRLGEVLEDGRSVYRFECGALADDVVHVFRVVPVGANDGVAVNFALHVVGWPDSPVWGWEYDAETGELIVDS